MAAVAQMQNALRSEVRDLKVKIVQLETAEAENVQLRKDLSALKQASENEKAQLELDFLNRLADIARENDIRVKELEGQLADHTRVNQRLNTEIHASETPEMVNARVQAIEKEHEREIAQLVNQKKTDMERLQYQLRVVQTKRDELTRQMEEAMVDLELKDKKIDSLELEIAISGGNESSAGSSSEDIQRMLRIANEENRKLRKDMTAMEQEMNSKTNPGDKYLEMCVKRLEQENALLKKSLQQAETSKKNQDISILQLERRNNDLKKSLQRLEKHVKDDSLDNSYGETTSFDQERERQQLEMALREAKAGLKKANRKNEELNEQLRVASSTENGNTIADLELLEQRNESLLNTCKNLENEIDEIKKESDIAKSENSLLTREITEVQSLLRSIEKENRELTAKLFNLESSMQGREAEPPSPEQRTSNIILRMEENLRREKKNNDAITASIRKHGSNRDIGSENSNSNIDSLREENLKLNEDVNKLQQKLEKERKVSRDLRREVSNVRANLKEDSSNSNERARVPLSFPSPGPASLRQAKGDGKTTPRGSVRGIAAIFEGKNIQSPPTETVQKPRHSLNVKNESTTSDELTGLKRDLEIERKQVKDMEEELTRQCEINCSLLKEINTLSLEMERQRLSNADNFELESKYNDDYDESNDLKLRMDDLNSELAAVTKRKEDLEAQDRSNKENFACLQDKVNNKVKEFERIHLDDKIAVQELQQQVARLEEELAESHSLVEDLRNKLNAQEKNVHEVGDFLEMKQTIKEKENMVARITNEKEQLVLSMKDVTSFRRDEIEELQSELMQMKFQASEKSREVESLKAELQRRDFGPQNIDRGDDGEAMSRQLEKENGSLRQKLAEASAERNAAEAKLKQFINDKGSSSKSVQILRERNAALKFEVEKLTKRLSRIGDAVSPATVKARRVAI
eukprot:scaffold1669_cov129-Cylindrotheca_fusiformis.AAC.54